MEGGYCCFCRSLQYPPRKPLSEMEPGTFTFRMNVMVGSAKQVKIPIDVVIQPNTPRPNCLPILIAAKSAGDFTNGNKRRKEEAKKMTQLKSRSTAECTVVGFTNWSQKNWQASRQDFF